MLEEVGVGVWLLEDEGISKSVSVELKRDGEVTYVGDVSLGNMEGEVSTLLVMDKLVFEGSLGRCGIDEFADNVGFIVDVDYLEGWYKRCVKTNGILEEVFGEDYVRKWNGEIDDETRA